MHKYFPVFFNLRINYIFPIDFIYLFSSVHIGHSRCKLILFPLSFFLSVFVFAECDQTTFLYEGRCYTDCPEHSYMVPEASPNQALQAVITTVQALRSIAAKMPRKQCAACHYSCLKCRGPNDYECTRCTNEAQYRRTEFNQTFCVPVPLDEITIGDNVEQSTSNFTSHNLGDRKNLIFFLIYLVFIISITIVSTFFIVRFIITQYCTAPKGKDQNNYAYDRIAYDGTNEQEHVVIERETLDDCNLSDSEEVEANN